MRKDDVMMMYCTPSTPEYFVCLFSRTVRRNVRDPESASLELQLEKQCCDVLWRETAMSNLPLFL